ncbi:MAG TPA: hypothetical protein VHL57_07465, partial [Flavobacteriales bacterium]|nr:hypothetical protein [Flavobacteriales bacterium]
PAVLFCAIDNAGRLYVLRERMGKQQQVEAFGNEVNMLTAKHFPDAGRVMDYGDPAVKQKKDTGQALAILAKKCRITVRFKHTPFDLSMQEVRHRFERLIEGKPAIQIARKCMILVNGLKGGYHMKMNGMEAVEPVKDGFYDHLCDALRYGVWNTLVGRQYGGEHEMPSSVEYSRDADPMN